MMKDYKSKIEKKWQQIATHPYYEEYREWILDRAENDFKTDPPRLTYSRMHRFYDVGDREPYDTYLEEYGFRLRDFYKAYMITKDEKYISGLADAIWDICNIECWTIPAHVREEKELKIRRQSLDLASCVLGMNLAEVIYFVGDKLPELVYRRARAELQHRIIDSFKEYKTYFLSIYKNNSNWNAVCNGAIFAVYAFLATDEEIESELPTLRQYIDGYIGAFQDDGCCIEGYMYWHYGFTYFCIFAELLFEYTNGKINLFEDEKIHKIAKFQQNICLNENDAISFSDSGLRFSSPAGLSHFLKSTYSDVEIGALKPMLHLEGNTRSILWTNPDYADAKFEPKSHIFTECQWFVHHEQGYSFATKAGHNAEMHNHRDVGSFIYAKDKAVSFCDPGGGKYDAEYFPSATRYTKKTLCASRGHNVPIINGMEQNGYNVKQPIIEQSEDKYVYSMEKFYDVPALKSLVRGVYCEKDRVIIKDSYEFDSAPESVEERFVSLLPIEIKDGKLVSGTGTLNFDKDLFDVRVDVETVVRNNDTEDKLYLATLKAKENKEKMEFTFILN